MVRYRQPLPLNGFPTKYIARNRFCTTITLNAAQGGVGVYTFRATSLWDPDYTAVTGGQPRGFTEVGNNYEHYTVIGSKITVRPVGPDASTANEDPTQIYGVTLSPSTTFQGSDWADIAEQRFAGPGNGIQKHIMMSRATTRRFSAKKFFGVKAIVGQDPYKGSTDPSGSNPTENAYFHVWVTSPNPLSDPDPTLFTIVIDYVSVYTEPITMGAS